MPKKSVWKTSAIKKISTYAVAALALLIAIVILGDEFGRHIKAMEEWVEGMGPWSIVVFVLLYAALNSVFFPDALLGIFAGASFGFTKGLVIVACGSLIGAVLQYFLSRHLLKPIIDRVIVSRPTMAAIQTAVLQQELRLQLLIRLTPLNRAMTSYVLGAAGVGFSRFVAACVAILPNLCLEVYFGIAGKHLGNVAGQPDHTAVLHDVFLVAGLVVAITVMVLVSRAARRAVEVATRSFTPELTTKRTTKRGRRD